MPRSCKSSSPTSASNGHCTHDRGTHLRAKLRYFFMSPCWKWHLKRQFPWKAWFQFIKIIIVTAQVVEPERTNLVNALSPQLILFGIERQTHVIFISESNTTFHHLFVHDWSTSIETLPYPRASGDFAVYTVQEFLDAINYPVQRVSMIIAIHARRVHLDRLVQQLDRPIVGLIRLPRSFHA